MSIPAMLPMRNEPGISIPFLTDSLICSCRVNYPDNGIRPKEELGANSAKSNISQKCPQLALSFLHSLQVPTFIQSDAANDSGGYFSYDGAKVQRVRATHCDTHRWLSATLPAARYHPNG